MSDAVLHVARGFADAIRSRLLSPSWVALPHQVPPTGDWYGWLLLAGRGAGKTDACAEYVSQHVQGPPCIAGPSPHWIGIIAPTLGDAATSCFSGVSGIRAHDPTATMIGSIGGTEVRWPNGSVAKLFGAHTPEDVERLRAGGNRCLFWLEELAAWRYLDAAWDQMRFGLRQGPRPHWVGSTTPKPRQLIKKLHQREVRGVELTHATMYDNPHLPVDIKDALEDAYAGSALGSQELYGKLVDQDENALWTRENVSHFRLREAPPLKRITVGVDPSGGAGEQGIVVAGATPFDEVADGRRRTRLYGYVLDDRTCHLSPDGWSRRALRAAVDWEADDVVVETNFGGDMAVATLRSAADELGVSIPIRTVHASRGKRPRAEPVAAKSAQGLWVLVGEHDLLEDQLCTWTPESNYSPDRLDAMVWTAWRLNVVSTVQRVYGSFSGSDMTQRSLLEGRR